MSYAEKEGRPRCMEGRMSRVTDNLAQASAGGKQVRPLEAVGDHGCDGTVPPAAARMSLSVRSRSGARSLAQENGHSSGLALGAEADSQAAWKGAPLSDIFQNDAIESN